jgi:hypothetical protein
MTDHRSLSLSVPYSLPGRVSRRDAIKSMVAAGCAFAAGCGGNSTASAGSGGSAHSGGPPVGIPMPTTQAAFLEDLIRQGCLFFWEQASAATGQVLDRANNYLGGALDSRTTSSIASTGFGLTVLCIADSYGYLPSITHAQIVERVQNTLSWYLNNMPEENGFFYHFNDVNTGDPETDSEVSSIDTSILMCGLLTARAYFGGTNAQIQSMATQIYERVNWPWMLNNGLTFSMGWLPDSGFLSARYDTYCELMMLYLLAIGSPTYPVAPSYWNNFARPVIDFDGYQYISGNADPLFTHQFSHAWFDFRDKNDAYANYFINSMYATQAHKAFCTLNYSQWYDTNYWGITSSDYAGGYTAWGGPPAQGPIDGTVVPCAAAGSLVFDTDDCYSVLNSLLGNYGNPAWGRYGFVDAFHPTANWYDKDCIGIDQGVSVLMAENLRSGLVWNTFMSNPEAVNAMQLAGFH